MITKPMLASAVTPEQLDTLTWPALVSGKIDGIRCIIHPDLGPVTRSFKPVPNHYVYEKLLELAGGSNLDGELIIVEAGAAVPFNTTQSGIMSRSGRPRFEFRAFDVFRDPGEGFLERHVDTEYIVDQIKHPFIQVVRHDYVASVEEFMEIASQHIEQGYDKD